MNLFIPFLFLFVPNIAEKFECFFYSDLAPGDRCCLIFSYCVVSTQALGSKHEMHKILHTMTFPTSHVLQVSQPF